MNTQIFNFRTNQLNDFSLSLKEANEVRVRKYNTTQDKSSQDKTMDCIADKILETRGNFRDKKGKRLFKVLWNNKTVTKEPLENLVDGKTYHHDILPILQEYQRVAKLKPTHRRHCLTCDRKTFEGSLFCTYKKNSYRCDAMKRRVRVLLS